MLAHSTNITTGDWCLRSRKFLSLKTDLVSKEREYIQKLKAKDALHEAAIQEMQVTQVSLERQLVSKDKTIAELQAQVRPVP